ncbi:MAG: hypothetical protein HY301_14060 [Verrucomicrobia bacterium]|nr:hypothetical protein [Verrucomicrobiota bacterium]
MNGDLVGTDPRLGPLADNGGPTPTCALLFGSPAIDVGDDSLTGTDQRGFLRLSGPHVDIGAFELQPTPVPQFFPNAANLPDGSVLWTFMCSDTNTGFTMLAATDLFLPLSNWTVLGPATNIGPGLFQFADPAGTNGPTRFYRVRSP